MWDAPADKKEPDHLENVYALSILEDGVNGDVWFTENVSCIMVKNSEVIKCSGSKAIHLKWDKQEGGCDWIGMGIGWDNWSGKDLSQIRESGAIQFKAYSPNSKLKSLPLAASLEDFGGQQAWLGISGDKIKYMGNDTWATVTLPLDDFSWEEFDADISNIKQMIIQFEATGDVYFDDIKIVPHKGKERKMYNGIYDPKPSIQIDGKPTEPMWQNCSTIDLSNGSKVKIVASKEYLYLSGIIVDNTPAQNSKSGNDIWNGDALEVAFSTNLEVNKKRKSYMFSDQQIGIRMNAKPMVWNWRLHKEVTGCSIKIVKTKTGYSFEASIPNSYFNLKDWQLKSTYGLEVALDEGSNSKRNFQYKWNSGEAQGFYQNPSLWGEMNFTLLEK